VPRGVSCNGYCVFLHPFTDWTTRTERKISCPANAKSEFFRPSYSGPSAQSMETATTRVETEFSMLSYSSASSAKLRIYTRHKETSQEDELRSSEFTGEQMLTGLYSYRDFKRKRIDPLLQRSLSLRQKEKKTASIWDGEIRVDEDQFEYDTYLGLIC